MADEKVIDFGNEESCRNYLVAKFDDLFQGINNLYGKELMEELIRRMEKTVSVFHQDVKTLLKDLKPVEVTMPFSNPVKPAPKPTEAPKIHHESHPPLATEEDDWIKHLS
jgi:hypothetical protein